MWLAQLEPNRQNPPCMTAQSEDSQGISPEILENIRGAVRIGGTFTSRNIFGEKLTLQEVLGLVSSLERDGAITLCAEWNHWNTWVLFHHGTWKPATRDQEKLVNDLVPPNAQRRALALFDDDDFLDLPIPEQFPFATRVVLANISNQNRWSYDMGRLHALLTVPEIADGLDGLTVREWFLRRLNVDGEDYECVATILLGSAFHQADVTIQVSGASGRG